MKFLIVSDFRYNPNSGAAGSLTTIGDEFKALGHDVEYVWEYKKKHIRATQLFRLLELPFVQLSQLKEHIKRDAEIDTIIVSQPYSWLAAAILSKKRSQRLFVNRTHGWEERILELRNKFIPNSRNSGVKESLILFFLKMYSRLTVTYHDAIICASSNDADYIRNKYPRHAHKVLCINYGLDSNYIGVDIAGKMMHNEPVLKFLFVGQYLERKGIFDIAAAFKEVSAKGLKYKLTFITDSSTIKRVETDFSFVPTEDLSILPWQDRSSLINIYLDHDVFLMPSYGEGFGKTIVEAMACAMCCVGYSEGALKDLGVHNQNCLIGNIGDLPAFKTMINESLANPQHIRQMGVNAYKSVQNLKWEHNAVITIDELSAIRAQKIQS